MGMMSGLWPAVALTLASQTTVPPPPTPEELAAIMIVLSTQEERMTVPVEVAGAGPYRFIIDTGSERTVISRELARLLRLPRGPEVNLTAMSGVSRVGTAVIPSLSVSTVPGIGRIQAPALDAAHLGAAGLLGIDTLQKHKVLIDFDTDTMAVMPSEKREKPQRRMANEIVVRAKSLFGQLIVTDAAYEGRPIRVVIDTGSPVSVGNSALRRLVSRSASRGKPMQMTSVTGGVVESHYAKVDRLRFGDITFNDLAIAFSDVPPFKRFGLDDKPALLLGMNTIRVFRRVQIDFANRELRMLMPREQFMARTCTTTFQGRCTS